jgi:hypothetical protein
MLVLRVRRTFMVHKRYTEEQIIQVLKEEEAFTNFG